MSVTVPGSPARMSSVIPSYSVPMSPSAPVAIAESRPLPMLAFSAAKPYPYASAATLPGVKFGHGGALCPICAVGALLAKVDGEVSKIEKQGGWQAADSTQAILKRREVSNIPHDKGTRLGGIPPKHVGHIEYTAKARTFDAATRRFSIATGSRTLLPAEVKEGIQRAAVLLRTSTVRPAGDVLPVVPQQLPANLGNQPLTFAISHNVERKTPGGVQNEPLPLGLVLVKAPVRKEVLVAATREYPSLEGLKVAPAGLLNMLAVAARTPGYDSVAVMVEPYQDDVLTFLNELKAQKIDVAELGAGKMPPEYDRLRDELYPETRTQVRIFRIPLNSIRELGTDAALMTRLWTQPDTDHHHH